MPLVEECRHLTAFCTPVGTFEWKVLPMGFKVGPQAFQRLVSWCVGRLKPHIRAYIKDNLVGTPPTCSGKGKLLDSQAIMEHYKLVRELFELLKECDLQVKKEKCFLFDTQVKYAGHILQEGQRSPAPGKVAAVRECSEDMIRTPKQMKNFVDICNWYWIYIPNYVSLAAPLMDSLAGKYRCDPDERTSKVPAQKQTLSWTDLMRGNFKKINTSLCEACSLYIPSDQGEFGIHTDASDLGIGTVLQQKEDQRDWRPCAFFTRKLQGSVTYDADENVLGYMGQRAWSVREKEIYALESCLLKFKSWISGRQVTVFTDHKSLESWYNEELCTMAGPLGRRGRWHEFLSRSNIVVVYKLGVENDAANEMSRWAYPVGLADDTNFHGSDADLEGVTQWEASGREKEQQLIAANQHPRKILEVRAPKGRPSPQDMQEQRERSYLLLQVNRLHNSVHYDSSSLPDHPAVDAVERVSDHCEPCCPFPSCFSQVSMSLDEDCSSEAESSVGPDEAIWNVSDETDDVSPLCYNEGDPTWVAASVFPNLTEVKVPPETKILYNDWMPHYRADRMYKRLLNRGLENQVSMDGYLWAKGPQWSHPHIRWAGKICVPQSIVPQVIQAARACAHPG